jgi:hypothetical protein
MGDQWLRCSVAGVTAAFLIAASPDDGKRTGNSSTLTVEQARTLPIQELAVELLGPKIGPRVIEAQRREYDATLAARPRDVTFFTKPVWSIPHLNGICSVDVIKIEYNWHDLDNVLASTELSVAHIEAHSRYKSFVISAGNFATVETDRSQSDKCNAMTIASDAFEAPSAGDAQWLAEIEREYTGMGKLPLTCDDAADRTCGQVRASLRTLQLNRADNVQTVDCAKKRGRDQVSYCYRITFPLSHEERTEWTIVVRAGMRDGFAPVEIRSIHVVREPRSFPVP